MIICRCEEVTYNEIESVLDQFHCSARELKMRTRAGMGICGGRTCRIAIEQIVQNKNQTDESFPPLKHQPPVRPISFEMLGGLNHE